MADQHVIATRGTMITEVVLKESTIQAFKAHLRSARAPPCNFLRLQTMWRAEGGGLTCHHQEGRIMAVGKAIGEFSLKSTSLTYSAAGSVQGNFEGTAKGEGLSGPVLGTLIALGAPGAKSGTCSWAGTSYLDNGEEVSGKGEGTWEKSGPHKWRIRAVNYLTDGRTIASDGEIALATRSFTGTLYEWS